MGFNQILSTHQHSKTFYQIRTRKMKATVAATLIGIFLLAGVPDIFASPGWRSPVPCQCINPFLGTEYASTGDPDILCNRLPGLCYVSCNSDCRDQDTAAGANRCQSSLACQAYLGGDSLPCRGGPPKLKKTVGKNSDTTGPLDPYLDR